LEWDRWREVGAVRAYVATTLQLLREPRASLELAAEWPVRRSLLFALFSYFCVLTPVWLFFQFGLMPKTFGTGAVATIAAFGYVAGAFTLLMVQLPLISAVEWLALRLLGQKQATFGRALQAHVMSESAMMLGVIPVVGAPVATVWSIGLRFLAIRRLQAVNNGQAVFAVLSPLLLLCGVTASVLAALLR
jgi:hypothetical protein